MKNAGRMLPETLLPPEAVIYSRLCFPHPEIIVHYAVMERQKNNWLHASELEKALLQYTDLIREAGAYPLPTGWGVVVYPDFVRLASLKILNIDETIREERIALFNQMFPPEKRICECRFATRPLVRNADGSLCRELPDAGRMEKESQAFVDGEEYSAIRRYFQEFLHREILPDAHLELELGLDSLRKVELQAYLEECLGRCVTDDMLVSFPTPRKLADALKALPSRDETESDGNGLCDGAALWHRIFRKCRNAPLDRPWRLAHVFANASTALLLRLGFRLHRGGMENIPDGPCILAANHQSYLDAVLIGSCLNGRQLCDSYFFAKAEQLHNPVLNALRRHHNVIIVNVNRGLRETLLKLGKVLQQGKKIIIFPEGTRTFDGKTNGFRRTYAILAKEWNVPVVPIVIQGAFEAMPRTRKWPRFGGAISVAALPPVHPTDGESAEEFNDRVRAAIDSRLSRT